MRRFSLRQFLKRVRALPVTISDIERIQTDSIPAVEELTGALKLIATHIHIPVMGNVYAITIWEEAPTTAELQEMRNGLVKELDEPTAEEEIPDGCRLFFRSENQRLPRTYIQKVLGDECLARLCAGLSQEERATVDEALVAMETFLRDIDRKIQAVMAILSKLPPDRIAIVNRTILNIVLAFRKKEGSSS